MKILESAFSSAIQWHDSKLIGFSIDRSDGRDDIILRLLGWTSTRDKLLSANVVFRNALGVRVNLDLASKRLCADDISSARLIPESEWIAEIRSVTPAPYCPADLFHFSIYLCPPGGSIDIVCESTHLYWQ
jgi:hypothetical protein